MKVLVRTSFTGADLAGGFPLPALAGTSFAE